ncbi:MAG: hypothetical protein AB7S77_23680 [Desulfatirhabdiaceae bacterium]
MAHTDMATMDIMALETAMITEIAASTALCMVPTAEATTAARQATGMAEADTADSDGAYSAHFELP